MTINSVQWRAVIGIFNCRSSAMSRHVCNLTKSFVSMFEILLLCCFYVFVNAGVCLLFYNGTETLNQNPGPRKPKTNNF